MQFQMCLFLLAVLKNVSIGQSTLVGQHPMKSLSSICPSVPLLLGLFFHPSVRLSVTKFSKIESLVFSDIMDDER